MRLIHRLPKRKMSAVRIAIIARRDMISGYNATSSGVESCERDGYCLTVMHAIQEIATVINTVYIYTVNELHAHRKAV